MNLNSTRRTSTAPASSNRKMKALAILPLALISSFALAQTDDVNRINTGYQNLRQFPGIDLQVWGTEKTGGQTNNLGATIEWPWDETQSQPLQKIIVREYRNGGLVTKTVGDGTTLWSFNPLRNEYIAHNYGSYNGALPGDYRLDLLQHFNSLSKLPAIYAARFLREMYGSTDPAFRSWVPGATVTVLTDTSAPQNDPITNRTYAPAPNARDYVMYELNGQTKRSVVFERTQTNVSGFPSGWCISNVYVAEQDAVHTLDFALTPTALTETPPDSDFAFAPPIGSHAIEGSMINGK